MVGSQAVADLVSQRDVSTAPQSGKDAQTVEGRDSSARSATRRIYWRVQETLLVCLVIIGCLGAPSALILAHVSLGHQLHFYDRPEGWISSGLYFT